jgi:dTDP-4-dehydrorhamnose 3,5-epimerase
MIGIRYTGQSSVAGFRKSGIRYMKKIDTGIEGLLLIEPTVFQDERGYFYEIFHQAKFAALGITEDFVQDNQSKSLRGTLRGLHYQIRHPQAKLCRVISGEVLDVAVDIRRGSPSFGKAVSTVLSADNKVQIFIPAGFAHGYLVLSESAEFVYKCTDFYHPEYERGLLWNDPDLGIDWNIDNPRLSEKDQKHVRLAQIAASDLPVYEDGRSK